ncbi:MAG: undecaprenyldiphospho-muramoylpentapeptide beta-N-acetylglucosaminyltransferase [Turicibacter sanguinis]|uniref:undecaprenyldiphospho-muramoylpentapeptide beta-N-acetylglucosaminyltransferase n=1 Tax=Turicibacter TaxID=191303 RepID=UPI0001FDB602|nr:MULTISPECIES: undecaprenyldiphospho-muramoylpentapeptide beta-N-acetylglucosaminyltransferase [Turicibacter]EGC91331.1 undecaprenyldiphospho-muramoylpentapeptide beta-N-acetylglucosaminyltransferase [Turicibacter sp. HGF1]MCU7196094.1 undecaprenyldiphospho-muramoylpentapeptide beta-N-acetylglucosaminyltransferase [Turicibacter sanguinis]MCU7200617.1 undecaprenyldiphospho-muramoylpentapeptide beta-N-acetylglucosaminyltransferase [Turicibacter sanguinis]MDB8554137.1 undecaprenyldiphospho-muram
MRILVTGGGTGGHIYPALAMVRALQQLDNQVEVLYIGTENGLEKEIVTHEGIPFKHIEISGFKRSLSLDNLKTIFKFFKSVSVSKQYIKEFNPDVVIGTGGYVCGPVVYGAAKLKIPTIIHEQNSLPGVTNKFLARYVNKVGICFEEARPYFPAEKVVLTGNPRASEVVKTMKIGKGALGLNPHKKTVMISGGSRGAEPINEAVVSMIQKYEKADYEVVFVTGNKHYDSIKNQIENVDSLKNVHILPFINNMPQYLVSVDLFVGRSGATFLSEITALGVPSILIPSPYVTANHQEYNARSVTDHGGGVLILEKDLTGEKLYQEIERIMQNSELRYQMQNTSKQLGIPDAAQRMITVMNEIIEKK